MSTILGRISDVAIEGQKTNPLIIVAVIAAIIIAFLLWKKHKKK